MVVGSSCSTGADNCNILVFCLGNSQSEECCAALVNLLMERDQARLLGGEEGGNTIYQPTSEKMAMMETKRSPLRARR